MNRIRFVESNVPENIRIHVHYVTRYRGGPFQSDQLPKWQTSCTLIDRESGHVVAYHQAHCNEDDQPVRKIGRAIAVGRAFKSYWTGVQDAVQSV